MPCNIFPKWYLLLLLAVNVNGAEFTFPYLDTPPELDGVIRKEEWQKAATASGFIPLSPESPATDDAQFFGGWDKEKLYLACRFPLRPGQPPRQSVAQNDGPVYLDDSLEIYLDGRNGKNLTAMTQFESDEYRHLIVNSRNVRYDGIARATSWNGDWQSAAATDGQEWTVECAIPWRDLGWQHPPEELGLALGWNDSGAGGRSWPAEAYHTPSRFATIRLRRQPALRLFGPTEKEPGKFVFQGALSSPGTGNLELWTTPAVGAPIQAELSETNVEIELPPLPPDASSIRIHYRLADVAQGEMALSWHPGIMVRIEKYFVRGEAEAHLAFNSLPDLNGREVQLRLRDSDGKTFSVAQRVLSGNEKIIVPFALRDLSPGEWHAEALIGGDNGEMYRGETVFTVITPPEWLNSTLGMAEDKVLPPWTPVEATDVGWRIWGREYGNAGFLFPGAITTQQQKLLLRPVTLRLWADGAELTPDTPELTVANTPARMQMAGERRYGDFRVSGTSVFDYDGVWFSQIAIEPLTPEAAARTISLTMELPLNAAMAQSLYTFVGNWPENRFRPLPETDSRQSYPFTPYWWAGNEQGGVAWFTESAQHYYPADAPDVLNIVNRGDEVLMQLRIITDGRIDRKKNFTFGFQATPVVAVQRDAWDDRVERFGHVGIAEKRGGAPVLADWKLNAIPPAGELAFDLKPAFAPENPNSALNQNLFNLQNGLDNRFFGFWSPSEGRLKVLVLEAGQLSAVLAAPANAVEAGQWHRLTLQWGDTVKLAIDGESVAEAPVRGFPGGAGSGGLWLGGWNSDWQIDGLRLRAADAETFLIEDDFDQPSAPESPTAACPSIPGKQGRGIALSRIYETPRSELDEWADNGAKAVVFHEDWTPIEDGFEAHDPEALRRSIAAIKQSGLRALLYFGFQLSSINPWFADFKNESLVAPENGGYKRSNPAQYARMVCYNSVWQDYLVWAVCRVMDQYGAGGVYLDATGYVWPCSNQAHQCGYTDENGQRRPTWPFMAVRRLMRRLYTEVRSRDPEGMVDFHCSTTHLMPSNGWSTSNWVGEEYSVYPRPDDFHFTQFTTLENIRMSLSWRHFGIPTDFLCYDRNPFTFAEALALSLPHDAPVRPESMENKRLIAELAAQRHAFRSRPNARWYPYWEKEPLLAALPEGVKGSAWLIPGEAVLLYVTNFGSEEQSVSIDLRNEVAGFSASVAPFTLKPMAGRVMEMYAPPRPEE